MNAAKEHISPDEAVELVREHRKLIVAKGKKVLHFDVAAEEEDTAILKAIIGPSGRLRAPTFKRGKTLVVGFHADAYDEVLG